MERADAIVPAVAQRRKRSATKRRRPLRGHERPRTAAGWLGTAAGAECVVGRRGPQESQNIPTRSTVEPAELGGRARDAALVRPPLGPERAASVVPHAQLSHACEGDHAVAVAQELSTKLNCLSLRILVVSRSFFSPPMMTSVMSRFVSLCCLCRLSMNVGKEGCAPLWNCVAWCRWNNSAAFVVRNFFANARSWTFHRSTGNVGALRVLALACFSPAQVFSKYVRSGSSGSSNSGASSSNHLATSATGMNARAHNFPTRRRNPALEPYR